MNFYWGGQACIQENRRINKASHGAQETAATHMHRAWMRQSDFGAHELGTMSPEMAAEADPYHHRCLSCYEAWRARKACL